MTVSANRHFTRSSPDSHSHLSELDVIIIGDVTVSPKVTRQKVTKAGLELRLSGPRVCLHNHYFQPVYAHSTH
jgi:hypothetical protein